MVDLPVRYPLDGRRLAQQVPQGAETVIRHLRGFAFVQLMARRDCAESLAQRLGIPLAPGRAGELDGATALPLAPGQWLMMAHQGRDGAYRRHIAGLADGLGHASEQSHGRAVLMLEGPYTDTILAGECRLDLAQLGTGGVAQTTMADVATLLYRPSSPRDAIMIVLYPGYLESFLHWLLSASARCSPTLIEETVT